MHLALLLWISFTPVSHAQGACTPKVSILATESGAEIESIHGSGAEIWAVGPNTALRWNGQAFVSPATPPPESVNKITDGSVPTCANRNFHGVWVNSPKDVWIGCDEESDNTGVAHFDGSQWHYFALHANRRVNSLWSSAAGDVWAINGNTSNSPTTDPAGYVGHYDTKQKLWEKVGFDISATGIWVTGNQNIYTLCHDTQICLDRKSDILSDPPLVDPTTDKEWGATEKSLAEHVNYSGTKKLYGIWASGPNDVWAVGAGGTILHSANGTSWQNSLGPAKSDLTAVYGVKNSVWAVGKGGTLQHFDGTKWQAIPSGTKADLRSVWVSPEGEAFVAGDKGTILRVTDRCASPLPAGDCGPRVPQDQTLRAVGRAVTPK